MTLTAIIGALVALMPPALLHPKGDKLKDEPEVEIARLRHEIERLERELAMQRSLKAHWRDEAKRLARHAREEREMRRNPLPVPTWEDMQRNPPQQLGMQSAQQAQQLAAMLPSDLGRGQLGEQNTAQAFGFCNCVPSRSQVWAAHPADLLVAQLNRVI